MKKIKIKDSDYLYAGARIRALENGIIGGERLSLMAQAKDEGDLERMLDDAGVSGETGYDAGIDARLAEAFDFVKSTSGSDVFDVLRYKYDAHNLKSAIKSYLRGTDAGHLYVRLGTVDPPKIGAMVRDRDFSAFPDEMARAASDALDDYAKQGDPQRIDTLIDKACYQAILRTLSDYEFPFLSDMISVKIDLTNILTTVRLLRMKSNYVNAAFLSENLIEGGSISRGRLVSLFEKDEEELFRFLSSGKYYSLAQYGAACPLSLLERACDDEYMRFVRDNTKYVSFGACILAAYLTAREYEAMNLRILLASKRASLPAEKITERLRMSYV